MMTDSAHSRLELERLLVEQLSEEVFAVLEVHIQEQKDKSGVVHGVTELSSSSANNCSATS